MKKFFLWLLTRLLGSPEEINGNHRCPTYLYRWCLCRFRGRAIYLHRFVGDDWSLDLHDHPKHFTILMLFGGYFEKSARPFTFRVDTRPVFDPVELKVLGTPKVRHYRAPYFRTFPPEHSHRIWLGPHRECWTLVMVSGAVKQWGFWNAGRWLLWRDYVRGKFSHLADARAVCRSIGEPAQVGQNGG